MLENNILSKRFNQKSMYIDRWVNYKFTYQDLKSYYILKKDLLAGQSFNPLKDLWIFIRGLKLFFLFVFNFKTLFYIYLYLCVIRFQIFIRHEVRYKKYKIL